MDKSDVNDDQKKLKLVMLQETLWKVAWSKYTHTSGLPAYSIEPIHSAVPCLILKKQETLICCVQILALRKYGEFTEE